MALNLLTGTHHDGKCEYDNTTLTIDNLIEGTLGFYCSQQCRARAEDCGDSTDYCNRDMWAQ